MSTDRDRPSNGRAGLALDAEVAQAVSAAVSEALDVHLRPELARCCAVPEITWRLESAGDSAWVLDGFGPARVSAQLAEHDYGAIRAVVEEIARTFGGRIRDVRPPFPDRVVRNVEVSVIVGGVPVTFWGTTG